jgi:uncharacterized membrane protein
MRFEKQITVKAPASKLFEYLSDLSRHGEWGQHNLKVTQTSSGPIAVGSTFKSVGHQFGANEDAVTVTELVPDERIGYESVGKAGTVSHAITLQPDGQGTQVTKSIDIVKPSATTRIFTPMFMILAPKSLENDLNQIKTNVEGQSDGMQQEASA